MPEMTNDRIADTFEQIADLLEFQGANPFRMRAYRNAARTLVAHLQRHPDFLNLMLIEIVEFKGF